MTIRAAGVIVLLAAILLPSVAAAQATPRLTREQRAALEAVVAAVDAAAQEPPATDFGWQSHTLRASDGSHYVAFSVTPPPEAGPREPVILYVRLATRRGPMTTATERSTIAEWLAGARSTPLPPNSRRGLALGDMPVFGAGSAASRSSQATQQLALLEHERERAREQRQAQERQRKAELEGRSLSLARTHFPFEDFDLHAEAVAEHGRPPMIRRSITAGPGEYDLFVGWVEPAPANEPLRPHVVRQPLDLPTASTSTLGLSSVILADRVTLRETPYLSDQQAAHPYAIGAMEIVPAIDNVLTSDEYLSLVVQIVNARPSPTGKPDIAVEFQLARETATGLQPEASLKPQYYDEATLPASFDLTRGHPLFAAVEAPVATLPRGRYRLQVTATDRLAGARISTETRFRIVATPAALLRSVPLGAPFDRGVMLRPEMLRPVVTSLRTDGASAGLERLIDALVAGQFADLLRDEPVSAHERDVRAALRGIGLYVLGDPMLASTVLRQATTAPAGVVQSFLGACAALRANDRDAVAAWEAALAAGMPAPALRSMLVDAYLRLGEVDRAVVHLADVMAQPSSDPRVVRSLSAIHTVQGREDEAVALLEGPGGVQGGRDAEFALLHALYAGFVHGRGPGATAQGQERFGNVARAYIAGGGRHRALVEEWLATLAGQ